MSAEHVSEIEPKPGDKILGFITSVRYMICCCQLILYIHTHQFNGLLSRTTRVSRYQKHTHTRLTTLCPGLPGWAGTRKVKPIWILLKQEAVSGSGIGWAIGKSAPRSRQITTPAPHHSVSYRPDALPAAQPTASKHWRHWFCIYFMYNDIYVMISVLLWMYYRFSAELTARFFFKFWILIMISIWYSCCQEYSGRTLLLWYILVYLCLNV